jgi:hypothetical protein
MTEIELQGFVEALCAFNQGILDENSVPALKKYCSPNSVKKFTICRNVEAGINEIYVCAGSDQAEGRDLPGD